MVLGISHIEAAFDTYVIDGIVNGVAQAVTGVGRGAAPFGDRQSANLYVGFFGGVAVLAILVFVLVTGCEITADWDANQCGIAVRSYALYDTRRDKSRPYSDEDEL